MKVTCIMPTAGRRRWIPQAIARFLAQDYPDLELVILDDGEGSVADLVPNDARIRYYAKRTGGLRSIGYLRNMCCDIASGGLIAHWDDDDWSSPDRISSQVRFYFECGDADIVGYHRMLFVDLRGREHHLIYYSATGEGYAVGTSMLYRRAFWQRHNFEDRDLGEDNQFQKLGRVRTVDGIEPLRMVARILPTCNTGKASYEMILAGNQPTWFLMDDGDAQLAKIEALIA